MARTLRRTARLTAGAPQAALLLAGLLLAVLLLAPLFLVPLPATAAPSPVPGGTVTVQLPAGTRLAPGTYDVIIRGNGRQYTGRATVGGQQPAPAPAVRAGSGGRQFLGLLVVLVLAAALAALVFLVVLRPYRRVSAYRGLLDLLREGRYKQALPGLTRLEATLPSRMRLDARFYIAFALYQIGDLDEAEHRLAGLHRENPRHPEIGYLLAYLKVQRRNFDGAEGVLETVAAAGGRLDAGTGRLYAIVEYQRALAALRDGRVDAAATLFEKVEALGHFRDQIPADLRNRHVGLGARALLEKDVRTARSHFERLEDAAARLAPAQRDDLRASAKLGLALAAWIEGGRGDLVDHLLEEAVRLLDPATPVLLPWQAGGGQPLADQLAALDEEEGKSAEQRERERVLRDVHMLRGMAVLRAWAADPDRAAPARFLATATARFACARALDATFADTYLVVGLLWHYLGTPRLRGQSLALLHEARKRGARDPELLRILNRHERPGTGERGGTGEVLDLIDLYLNDDTVRAEVRESLRRQRERFGGRPREGDSRPEPLRMRVAAPTVAELTDRAELLMARVRLLGGGGAGGGGAGDLDAALELARGLEQENRALTEQARAVEQKEAELLARIGDALLRDDGG